MDERRSGAPDWLPRAALTVAFVILGVLATLWVAMRLRTLIFIVFISVFVAVALDPAAQYLARRGWSRRLAAGTVFLGAAVLFVGFVAALVPLFITQAADLAENLPEYVENVQDFLDRSDVLDIDLIDPQIAGQLENLGDLLGDYGTRVAGGIFAVGNTVFGAVFQMVTIALFSYYIVAEGPRFRRTVLSFLPPRRQREALQIWEIAVEKTGGYVYSRLLLAAVAASFTAVVLGLLGVPYPIALGLWVGVLSQFVPVIGTYIAAVLPVIVALTVSPPTALWVLVALVAYQQLENFVVAPRITARAMAIHPAVSIGAVIAGASLLGGVGAVLALPVAATIQAFISTAIHRHELIDAELLTEDPPKSRPDDPAVE